MYMESYGGATSVAEGIIKKAVTTKVGLDEAKAKLEKKEQEKLAKSNSFEGEPQMKPNEAVSEGGISPITSGVGEKVNPAIVRDMERYSQQKAIESLNSKIENLQARNIYLEDKLGRMSLKK